MISPALLQDVATLRKAIQDNLAIVRPTAFNKMQLDELRYFLAVYEKELDRVSKDLPFIGEQFPLSQGMEGRENYERHENFSDKNRGI